MKKSISIALMLIITAFLFPMAAYADVGPKPSVIIDFNGLAGETYYAALLSSVESTGPYSALDDDYQNAHYQQGEEGYDIFLKFAEYKDADGFYFLQFFEDCSQTQQLSWTYHPPEKFKVLLYFPEKDRFVVSGKSYERYAFDSYFTADVSGLDLSDAQSEPGIIVEKSYHYMNEMLSLIARVLLTIAIELGIALLFGFRERKLFRFIVIVNVITQIALNLALNIINYYSGQLAFVIFFVLLEIAVTIVEAILYSYYLKKHSKKTMPEWKPCVYALAANAASFALGLGLSYWIPGIFCNLKSKKSHYFLCSLLCINEACNDITNDCQCSRNNQQRQDIFCIVGVGNLAGSAG